MADRFFDPERWRYADEERYRDGYRRPRYPERDYERGGFSERNWGRSGERASGWRDDDRSWGNREYARRMQTRGDDRGDDRGFFDRAGDEVRSWFGDEEAQRRRMMDEREERWADRPSDYGYGDSDRRGHPRRWDNSEDVPRQWGYIDRNEWPGRSSERSAQTVPTGWRPQFGSGTAGTSYYGRPGAMGGQFTGRGPRGWQRSDERIKEDVCERMWQHPELDASDVEVRVANCEITLTGSVSDRNAKRLAEDVAESVSGVREVHNQIRVAGAEITQDQSQQTSQRGFGGERRIA